MRVSPAIALVSLSLMSTACNKGSESVAPDVATQEAAAADEPAEPSAAGGVTPELMATYEGLVRDVYSRDAERCLEDQMEVEDSKYMRSGFTLKITVAKDGTAKEVSADNLAIQVRNYEGEVLKEGDAEGMKACVLEAAATWEFEPLPPSETTFSVAANVGD